MDMRGRMQVVACLLLLAGFAGGMICTGFIAVNGMESNPATSVFIFGMVISLILVISGLLMTGIVCSGNIAYDLGLTRFIPNTVFEKVGEVRATGGKKVSYITVLRDQKGFLCLYSFSEPVPQIFKVRRENDKNFYDPYPAGVSVASAIPAMA